MAKKSVYLGFDIGASSGRAVQGCLDSGRLTLKEINRFSNGPVQLGGTLYWDFLSLWQSVIKSMEICSKASYTRLAGIGVDTWGVDFGLIDANGQLLSNPVCYRDNCTCGMDRYIERTIGYQQVYAITGLAVSRVATLPQLVALTKSNPAILRNAKCLLHIPDIFRYFLCGKSTSERTSSGSSQLADIRTGKWSDTILEAVDLPKHLFGRIVKPGTVSGSLKSEICQQTGLKACPVIAVAGHDTASAAAAMPIVENDCAFLSCGTWSVLGILTQKPILTDEALKCGFVNEFGFESILFVRNLMGLYLFENLYRTLRAEQPELNYELMVREATSAKPFSAFINPNSDEFFVATDLHSAMKAYLRKTHQKCNRSNAAIVRTLLEALVFSYRLALNDLVRISGRKLRRICIVGGGVRNTLLCQMIANGTGLEVVTGPAEATVVGNIAMQALATGLLNNADDIRTMVLRSFESVTYEPQETQKWDKTFSKYLEMTR